MILPAPVKRERESERARRYSIHSFKKVVVVVVVVGVGD
jgi:hypothetical protein